MFSGQRSRICFYCVVIAAVMQPALFISSFSPPFRNIALQKPITIEPASQAVCGENTREEYCRSYTDTQSVLSCWKLYCSAACPLSNQPHHELLFNRIQDWVSTCVEQTNSTVDPSVAGSFSVHFKGTGSPCYLIVQHSWMGALIIADEWSITLTVWLYTDMDNKSGTIFDIADQDEKSILNIALDEGIVKINVRNVTYTQPEWAVSSRRWTHLAIQIHSTWASVFVDGKIAPPATYGIMFESPRLSANFRIGQSFAESDPYIGYMQDFRLYMRSISNRQVSQVMTGRLPSVRVQNSCLCPSAFPNIPTSAEAFCEQNPGNGRLTSPDYRLNQEAFPVEFINDGSFDTKWLSKTGNDESVITVDLLQQYEIRHISVLMYSPFPSLVTVERRLDYSSPWSPWQHFSQNCITDIGINVNSPLGFANDVNCKYLIPANSPIPYTSGKIIVDLLEGRPGQENGTLSQELREFLQAVSVRLTIKGHPYVNDVRHRYHAINELTINATCNCHGHGVACTSDDPYVCDCAPSSHTQGDTCDECTSGSFQNVLQDPYAADFCQACDCHPTGSVHDRCQQLGGQCECKPNISGRRCDTCAEGYFNLTSAGCQPCVCDVTGMSSAVTRCDMVTGQCECAQNMHGLTCDQCLPGFYRSSVNTGCDSCDCHVDGSVSNDTCNVTTGQCQCKANVIGRACDTCQAGTYGLSSDGCHPCDCDSAGAMSTDCDTVTGQCQCHVGSHIGGVRCDACEDGWYALDATEYDSSGCQHACACDVRGTHTCAHLGGVCECLDNVTGIVCDKCADNSYGFGGADGCQSCGCNRDRSLNVTCDVVTGQCHCGPHTEGQQCERCSPGAALLPQGGGCVMCECNPRGTVMNTTCDEITGQCQCMSDMGNISKAGVKCMTYMESVLPTYGPKSGGTKITLYGGFLGDTAKSKVMLGKLTCHVNDTLSGATTIVCLSSSLVTTRSESIIDIPQNINVTFADGGIIQLGDMFLYKKDPIITKVEPNQSILGGGIKLTVIGMHLDSIAFPAVLVMMVYKGIMTNVFENGCDVRTTSLMECLTPEITLPSADQQRRRRDTDSPNHSLNSDLLKFYLGFRLDGVDAYRNMSNALSGFGELQIFANPVFKRFEGDIKVYRPYWPYNDRYVVIEGDRLNYGAAADDYNVTIGEDFCMQIDLATNQISCIPPDKQPEPGIGGHKNGAPTVTIRVGNVVFVAGYLHYEHTFWENKPFRYGIIGGVIAALVLIVVIAVIIVWWRRRKRVKNEPAFEVGWTSKTSYGYATVGSVTPGSTTTYGTGKSLLKMLPPELRGKVEACLITDSKRMVLGKVIGEGNYGRVHIGRLAHDLFDQPIPVAIKTLRENKYTISEVGSFLEEATLMKDFKHQNILGLTGVVIENERAFVLLPYMENGDLKSFISKDDNMLTVGELIDYGRQIANGMVYLEDQHFVHRDLACRNCMISKDMVVKIADFGLSRDIYEQDYYKEGDVKRAMPIKWMALESLERGVFSSKTDVWSFGVLMWELLTRACLPYPDVDVFDMKNYLLCGNRMDRPDYAPDDIYALMLRCWSEEPTSRPDFRHIKAELDEFLDVQNSKTQLRHKQRQQVPSSIRNSTAQQRHT